MMLLKSIISKINKEKITENKYLNLTLQYDYITAYLDFYIVYSKFEKQKKLLINIKIFLYQLRQKFLKK